MEPLPVASVPLERLSTAVARLVDALEHERAAVRAAEAQIASLYHDLARLEAGAREPARLHRALRAAEARAEALDSRLNEARDAVDRLLGRVRFLEDQGS